MAAASALAGNNGGSIWNQRINELLNSMPGAGVQLDPNVLPKGPVLNLQVLNNSAIAGRRAGLEALMIERMNNSQTVTLSIATAPIAVAGGLEVGVAARMWWLRQPIALQREFVDALRKAAGQFADEGAAGTTPRVPPRLQPKPPEIVVPYR